MSPISGVITGRTDLTVGVDYPGVASSTVYCAFNDVLIPAVYEEVSNAQGTVLCTTPHLGYCEDGARRYEPGKCVITQSLQTIATPFSVALHVEVDGIRSSNVASFTYTAVPSIDYIYPASGPSYASIVLVGNRLE